MEVRLENWAIVHDDDPYLAPELRKQKLHGQCFGHPRFEDGEAITTSSIQSIDGEVIVTRNTRYVLGQVDPAYENLYPNAKNRLLNSLQNAAIRYGNLVGYRGVKHELKV